MSEWFSDNWEWLLACLALVVSIVGAAAVFVQLRYFQKQLQLDARIRIVDTNRDLLTLGFSDPELFEVLSGKAIQHPEKARRYLQLFLNQIDVIWFAYKAGLITHAEWPSYEDDIRDFLRLQNMQDHWASSKHYYSEDLRSFLDSLIPVPAEVPSK